MKKIVNVICLILIILSIAFGYYIVTNSSVKNEISNLKQNNNMEEPLEKPNGNALNHDSNTEESKEKLEDNNFNQPPEMANDNIKDSNGHQGNLISNLSIKNIVILELCILVFIISLLIIILNSKDKKIDKDKKMILLLSSFIISCTLTFVLVCVLNKYYYIDNKPDNRIHNDNQNVTTNGTLEVTTTFSESDKTYDSSKGNASSIVVEKGGNYTLDNGTITKSGDTSNVENSEFCGLNAGILVKNTGALTLTNSNITTKAKGSNALFATGDGSKITVSNTKINTYNDSSRGLDATYGGEMEAKKMDIHTRGASSATLATDRGEGTITVSDSTLKTEGKGSPIIYSTGNITLSDSEGVSTNSQAVVVEGKNSATINNTTITTSATGNRNDVDHAGIMIYQSMSGDASTGRGSFISKDSSIIIDSSSSVYKSAPMFFVTNTEAEINLENTTFTYGSNLLLNIEGTSQWGSSGSNGGIVTLNATNQILKGNITVDKLSELSIHLENSTLTSTINHKNTAKKISVSIDSKSKWDVSGESHITSLTIDSNDLSLIDDNGNNIYYDKDENSWLNGKTYILQDGGKLIPI